MPFKNYKDTQSTNKIQREYIRVMMFSWRENWSSDFLFKHIITNIIFIYYLQEVWTNVVYLSASLTYAWYIFSTTGPSAV